jgi:hypothetical protein
MDIGWRIFEDFDLGADYDAVKVRAQIRAVEDSARLAAGCAPKGPANDLPTLSSTVDDKCMNAEIGWMLWSPGNSYTRGALRPGGNF